MATFLIIVLSIIGIGVVIVLVNAMMAARKDIALQKAHWKEQEAHADEYSEKVKNDIKFRLHTLKEAKRSHRNSQEAAASGFLDSMNTRGEVLMSNYESAKHFYNLAQAGLMMEDPENEEDLSRLNQKLEFLINLIGSHSEDVQERIEDL